jgi:hypothetical protein
MKLIVIQLVRKFPLLHALISLLGILTEVLPLFLSHLFMPALRPSPEDEGSEFASDYTVPHTKTQ